MRRTLHLRRPCYWIRIVLWLLLTAAAAIFCTLHFHLYLCCQSMTHDLSLFAVVMVVSIKAKRAIRNYFYQKQKIS